MALRTTELIGDAVHRLLIRDAPFRSRQSAAMLQGKHPDAVNHAAGSTYRQSFPDVAAQALLAIAPVSLTNVGLSLTGASGTVFESFPM